MWPEVRAGLRRRPPGRRRPGQRRGVGRAAVRDAVRRRDGRRARAADDPAAPATLRRSLGHFLKVTRQLPAGPVPLLRRGGPAADQQRPGAAVRRDPPPRAAVHRPQGRRPPAWSSAGRSASSPGWAPASTAGRSPARSWPHATRPPGGPRGRRWSGGGRPACSAAGSAATRASTYNSSRRACSSRLCRSIKKRGSDPRPSWRPLVVVRRPCPSPPLVEQAGGILVTTGRAVKSARPTRRAAACVRARPCPGSGTLPPCPPKPNRSA